MHRGDRHPGLAASNAFGTCDVAAKAAAAFRSLFGTKKIQQVPVEFGSVYVCEGRSDTKDYASRPDMSMRAAKKAASMLCDVFNAQEMEPADLTKLFSEVRVFGYRGGQPFCACPVFAKVSHMCHHRLGLDLHLGSRTVPPSCDPTPLQPFNEQRGRSKKAPGRYATPVTPDAKDMEIKRLQDLLASHGVRSPGNPKRPQVAQQAAASSSKSRKVEPNKLRKKADNAPQQLHDVLSKWLRRVFCLLPP